MLSSGSRSKRLNRSNDQAHAAANQLAIGPLPTSEFFCHCEPDRRRFQRSGADNAVAKQVPAEHANGFLLDTGGLYVPIVEENDGSDENLVVGQPTTAIIAAVRVRNLRVAINDSHFLGVAQRPERRRAGDRSQTRREKVAGGV
jgi:hypothetical protein